MGSRMIILLFMLHSIGNINAQKNLHQKAILVDTHNDVISQIVLRGKAIDEDLTGKAHTDIARLKSGGVDVQIFSIFCDESFGMGTAFKMAIRQIDSVDAIISRHPDLMVKTYTTTDISAAIKANKIACLTGVEGGHMIENRMDYLDSFYNRGARYLTLTWNNSTSWATSAKDETEGTLPPSNLRQGKGVADKGLDSLGVAIVQHMNALGMLIDVSHMGEATIQDVLRVSKKPIIASHSSVYALCPFRRNLKDDQIKAIAKNGGVVDINFYSGFLDSNYDRRKKAFQTLHKTESDSLVKLGKKDYEIDQWFGEKYKVELENLRPPLSLLIDHIDYIVKLVGPKYVGLGSDFDGIESAPKGLDGVQDYPAITKALQEKGYSAKNIKRILGGNFMRVLKANERP